MTHQMEETVTVTETAFQITGRALPPEEFRLHETAGTVDVEAVFEVLRGSLAAYRVRRARAIGPGGGGALALLRDWYDDGRGRLAVAHATPDAAPAEVR